MVFVSAGRLYALDDSDGSVIWNFWSPDGIHGPVVVDGVVYPQSTEDMSGGVLQGVRKCSCASGIAMAFETGNRPQARSTQKMLADDHPDRIQIS